MVFMGKGEDARCRRKANLQIAALVRKGSSGKGRKGEREKGRKGEGRDGSSRVDFLC